jgi:hypothetical protein
MKNPKLLLAPLAAACLALAGCASEQDRGPYLAQNVQPPVNENIEQFVLMDPGVQYSVTRGTISQRTLEDGRLEVVAQVRNRENRRIEVQVQCIFKDQDSIGIGDETPWQTLILTESATEPMRFVSANDKAKRFTIRVRQAR